MTKNTIMRELNDLNTYSYYLEWRTNKREKIKRIVIIRISRLKKGTRKHIIELSSLWRQLSEEGRVLIADGTKYKNQIFNSEFFNSNFKDCKTKTLLETLKLLQE